MYQKIVLPSGIRLILVPNHNTETVTALALFGVGSRDEAGRWEGMAHFLEHMLFKGTARRTALDISRELDAVGAGSNAFTGKEYTGFYVQAGKQDLGLSLDILSDMLLHSAFAPEEIEREKGAVIEEINMYEDAPMRDIPSVFENLLYQGMSLGHDQLGNKENVRSFTRRDLLSFYRRHYRADNLAIAIAGNFDQRAIARQVEGYFSPWPQVGQKPRRLQNRDEQKEPALQLKYKKTDQSNFSLGFRALPTGHDDLYALEVLSTILGGNSSSRLFASVRERAGLAYYIYTYTEDFHDVGYFTVQAGVGNEQCAQAIELVMAEIGSTLSELLPEEEIARAKNYLRGRMAIALESSSALANFVTAQEILSGEILTPQKKFARINAVQAADLQRVARAVFRPERLNLAIIGPFKDPRPFARLLKF